MRHLLFVLLIFSLPLACHKTSNGEHGSATDTIAQTSDVIPTVEIVWTAYKFPDYATRAGVSGTFDNVALQYDTNAQGALAKLATAAVTINVMNARIGEDALKTSNVRDSFFAALAPQITASVKEVIGNEVIVTINMNNVSHDYPFALTAENSTLVLTGTIDNLLDFNTSSALDALQTVCGAYHENKVWPDIGLRVTIHHAT